jgi:hypothetical protein
MFKSFKPRKLATKSRNNYRSTNIIVHNDFNELCSECGYPYGIHYNNDCPTNHLDLESAVKNLAKVIPYHALKKLTQREKDIRAFRKFLYDNDALEAWYKNRKNYTWRKKGSVFAPLSKERFIIGAFVWCETSEGANYWTKLNEKWERML